MLPLLLLACTTQPTTPHLPDMALVVLDTVRYDRTGLADYERPTTPALDGLGGRRYSRAWATAPWTPPSHASLFTGQLPASHGVTQQNWTMLLQHDTIAEVLRDAGYRTIGVVANPMLSGRNGFKQGFEVYDEVWHRELGLEKGTRDEVVARRVAHHMAADDDRPVFLFVNLKGAHSPYDSCGSYCDTWVSDPTVELAENQWRDVFRGRVTHDDRTLTHLSERYDAEVRKVDDAVGAIAGHFEEQDWLVVTSDHGEHLGEHGLVGHMASLREQVTRVPLLVRGPGVQAGVDDHPSQLQDVFGLLAGAAGIERREQGLDLLDPTARVGRSILLAFDQPGHMFEKIEVANEAETRALAAWAQPIAALVEGDLKLIRTGETAALYDLASDPAEAIDLAATRPDDVARLTATLDRMVTEARALRPLEVVPDANSETRDALKALGYID
jgi:arylsulfatase A-like enzyme